MRRTGEYVGVPRRRRGEYDERERERLRNTRLNSYSRYQLRPSALLSNLPVSAVITAATAPIVAHILTNTNVRNFALKNKIRNIQTLRFSFSGRHRLNSPHAIEIENRPVS